MCAFHGGCLSYSHERDGIWTCQTGTERVGEQWGAWICLGRVCWPREGAKAVDCGRERSVVAGLCGLGVGEGGGGVGMGRLGLGWGGWDGQVGGGLWDWDGEALGLRRGGWDGDGEVGTGTGRLGLGWGDLWSWDGEVGVGTGRPLGLGRGG